MLIANAIYDIVFKYLMEDERVAKILLSGLLKMEVEELEFQPQEYISDVKNKTLTIFRIDFKAKVKLNTGESKVVLIELQKAKFPSDIMRFRRYLGEQYISEQNLIKHPENSDKKIALPIITIYFLGYSLENLPDKTIIRIKRKYIDDVTNEELEDVKDPFIEALTHDSIIVQIEAIKKKKHRNILEKALSIFEPGTKHAIEISEEDYPEEYKPVIRRLIKAYADEKVRKVMQIEDEVLNDLMNAERRATKAEQELEKAKQTAHEAKIKLARKMKKYGESVEDIQKETGLSKDEIENL